ncbi:LamB/YcsF family protein [Litorivivens sp.]|uniref:LamB/YcsF family protein n=1 Tax=Litorivivens sp. TaxID=2020868 RepID=UPI003566C26F
MVNFHKFPELGSLCLSDVTSIIDINCDLGEGMGSDAELLNIATSANIACGAHAGDPQTMQHTLMLAKQRGVAAGAHPGYQDREGFGRRPHSLSDHAMVSLVQQQIESLAEMADAINYPLSHVRAHGALGNLTDADEKAATLLLDAMAQRPLALMTLTNSAAQRIAQQRHRPVVTQFFADRAYDDNGQLVARSKPDSVLHDEKEIVQRLLTALDRGILVTYTKREIPIAFDSICVHGDTPNALSLAEKIRKVLEDSGAKVRPFVEH